MCGGRSLRKPLLRSRLLAAACFFVVLNYAGGVYVAVSGGAFSWSNETLVVVYLSLSVLVWFLCGLWVLKLGKAAVSDVPQPMLFSRLSTSGSAAGKEYTSM